MARATYKTRGLTEISPKVLNIDLENVACCMKRYKTLILFAAHLRVVMQRVTLLTSFFL